ncbi:hypothetical protein ACIRRI_54770, partial [Streptomyces mirabilis]|uniref:hypothetical protein n=1 Tax=Streptomyces mirabilis TaxID=68239 RepID=UPI00380CDB6E
RAVSSGTPRSSRDSSDTQPTPRSNEQNDHANLSESTKPVYAFPNGVLKARGSSPETAEE